MKYTRKRAELIKTIEDDLGHKKETWWEVIAFVVGFLFIGYLLAHLIVWIL